jgi:hypothetical protein
MQNRVRWTRGGSAEVSKFELGTHGFSGTPNNHLNCTTYLSARRLKSQGPNSAPAASPVVRPSCDQPTCLPKAEVFADCSDPLSSMTGTPGPKFQPTAPFPSRQRDVARRSWHWWRQRHGQKGAQPQTPNPQSTPTCAAVRKTATGHGLVAPDRGSLFAAGTGRRFASVVFSPRLAARTSLRSLLKCHASGAVMPLEAGAPVSPPRAGRRSFVPRNPFGAGHPGFVGRG